MTDRSTDIQSTRDDTAFSDVRTIPRSNRVTLIGYVALTTSVLAALGAVGFAKQMAMISSGAEFLGLSASVSDILLPASLFLLAIGVPVSVGVDLFAGFRGIGNRLMGITGGLVMLSTAVWFLLSIFGP